MKVALGVGTNAYDGYPLEVMLEQISKVGAKFVEIAAIKGYFEHVRPEKMSGEEKEKIKALLKKNNLSCESFSSHVDLTEEGILPVFKKRMEFAKEIGAKIVNTNSGPLGKEKKLYEVIKEVDEYAKSLELIVALETHGDIISGGEDIKIIKKIDSPNIKMNYDFGNVFYFSGGKIRPEKDFEKALEYPECICHLHIKDIKFENNEWKIVPIGEGVVDYERVFYLLEKNRVSFPASIELPLRLGGKKEEGLKKINPVLPLDEINNIIKRSLDYVRKVGKDIYM